MSVRLRLPAALVSGILCSIVGLTGGFAIGTYTDTGLREKKPEIDPVAEAKEREAGEAKESALGEKMSLALKNKTRGGETGNKGGADKGKTIAGFQISPKSQLSQLIVKLDTLTKAPLALEIKPEQKKQIRELLAGLENAETLTEDDAKSIFDALLKLVEGQKDLLEAAGYRWPGTPFAAPGEQRPNPFKEGDVANRLKSLRNTIGK